MRVFLSHARKDEDLARKLRDRLVRVGFSVWLTEEQITPGDNWARKTGEALDESELMILLLTPKAMESDGLRHNLEFALGSQKYEHRVFSVFVGPTLQAGKDMPWILLRLPHAIVESARGFGAAAAQVKEYAKSIMSHSDA